MQLLKLLQLKRDEFVPRHVLVKTYLIVVSFFVIGVSIWSYLAFHHTKSLQEELREKDARTFSSAALILKEKVDSYIHGMQGVGGVMLSTDFQVTPKQFRSYAEFRHFFNNFPGSLGFGFIRWVERKDLAAFVERQKKLRPNFQITQINPHFHNHFIIEFIEPIEANGPALGLDIASEDSRYIAAMEARRTGVATLTKPIHLVQRGEKVFGFLYLLPVYRDVVNPLTLVDREKNFVGWAYAPILASQIEEYLEEVIKGSLGLEIDDVTDTKNILPIFPLQNEKLRHAEKRQQEISVGGRVWRLTGFSKLDDKVQDISRAGLFIWIFGCFFMAGAAFLLRGVILNALTADKYLLSLEAWNQAVIEHANYGIIATNENGIIQIYNAEAEALLGYKARELVNLQTPALFHLHDEIVERNRLLQEEYGHEIAMGFETFTFKANLTGKPDIYEWTLRRKDGTTLPTRLSIMAISNKEGRLQGYLGIIQDLTEIKRLNETVEGQRVSLINSAKLSALGEMAGGIAHEINNPLAIISSRSELLLSLVEQENLNNKERIKTEINKIIDTIFRISKIIRGLRSFSRDSSQEKKHEVAPQTIIEDTLDLCRERFVKNDVELSINLQTDRLLNCRPIQISQVLMNLLNNAFDATATSSPRVVRINVLDSGQAILIQVEDNGSGIPAEVANKVLEPFFTTKDVGKGTGLGLSISRGIVESHGGTLSFESVPGRTVFTVRLPY